MIKNDKINLYENLSLFIMIKNIPPKKKLTSVNGFHGTLMGLNFAISRGFNFADDP